MFFPQGHIAVINSISYSRPDGKYILTTSEKDGIMVWNSKMGKLIKVLKEQEKNYVYTVKYSFDGKYIIST